MTEIVTSPTEAETQPVLVKGRQRDVIPTRFIDILDFTIQEAGANDEELQKSIAIVRTWIAKKIISKERGNDLMEHLWTAFINNDHIKDVLVDTRRGDMKAGNAEIERISRVRRSITQDSKGEK